MHNEQKQWIENKLISNYKWLIEEISRQLRELEITDNLEEKERIIKNTEWTISEFTRSNKNNFSNLKKMKVIIEDNNKDV